MNSSSVRGTPRVPQVDIFKQFGNHNFFTKGDSLRDLSEKPKENYQKKTKYLTKIAKLPKK